MFIQCFVNSKIIKISLKKEIDSLGVGVFIYLFIIFLYIVELHMYHLMQDIYLIVIKGIEVFNLNVIVSWLRVIM